MGKSARFQFDPRLATLLGESYRSSEQALKELIDNAWDADAKSVRVTLPSALTMGAIVIEDDGTGMTEKEVESEYLKVASDRRTRKGILTPVLKRQVKGRKGIGKFAGLMAASTMRLTTRARGTQTEIQIRKSDLLESKKDLENIDLPLAISQCSSEAHGTMITLTDLNQGLEFPSPEKLKEVLVIEYGRSKDFLVFVNGEPLAVEDVPGEQFKEMVVLPGVGPVKLALTIAEKRPLKHPGIVVRVGGKVVGKPLFFGLDEDEGLPGKLLKRVYGEIEADGLSPDVTADWGAIIENSTAFAAVSTWAKNQLKEQVETVFRRDLKQARARRQQVITERLSHIPEHRRRLAEEAIQRILLKFYGESEDRIDSVIAVMLDSFERDEYWIVVQAIEKARHAGVARLAEALSDFGLVDVAVMIEQARNRLAVLDQLDHLLGCESTKEKDLHLVIEKNLWLLEGEFTLISSNKTLAKVMDSAFNAAEQGKRARHRPDLLLCNRLDRGHLLIEFKEPRHPIDRDDENQAVKYRDDLRRKFENIEILIIGGRRAAAVDTSVPTPGLRVLSYVGLVSAARSRLQWLLSNLAMDRAVP